MYFLSLLCLAGICFALYEDEIRHRRHIEEARRERRRAEAERLARQAAALEAAAFTVSGYVKWFDQAKGFGFVRPYNGLPDILLHISVLRRDGYETAREWDHITVEALHRDRGMQAFRVLALSGNRAIRRMG